MRGMVVAASTSVTDIMAPSLERRHPWQMGVHDEAADDELSSSDPSPNQVLVTDFRSTAPVNRRRSWDQSSRDHLRLGLSRTDP